MTTRAPAVPKILNRCDKLCIKKILNRCDKLCIKNMFFLTDVTSCVSKIFFFLTDVTSCVSKGATECLSCWSRGRLQQGHCLPHYICFLLVLRISLPSSSVYHDQDSNYSSKLVVIITIMIISDCRPDIDWSVWVSIKDGYWQPTSQFGIILLFEDIEDIWNKLLNFGSSTSLRILRIIRILRMMRILRILGTNFPIWDHPPHWRPPSSTWWTHLQHEVDPSYQLNEDIIHLYFCSKRHRRHKDIIVCPSHSFFFLLWF